MLLYQCCACLMEKTFVMFYKHICGIFYIVIMYYMMQQKSLLFFLHQTDCFSLLV